VAGQSVESGPFGVGPTGGVVHKRSPLAVGQTVDRLLAVLEGAGATVFAVIDHSGEAARVGLSLRDTKLVIFGNPKAGTPVMVASPLAALDLPLKVLVWSDDHGDAWMSHVSGRWLADRHRVPGDLAGPLSAVDVFTDAVVRPA
jgi:uncharacterized protein (DUF302 family)